MTQPTPRRVKLPLAALLIMAAALALPSSVSGTVAAARDSISSGPAADIAAIRAVGLKWREYYAAGRYADIPDLYTVDTVVMPRGRPKIEGREQMRRAIGGLAAGRRVDIRLQEREIHAVGNMGWYVGDFVVTYTSAAGGPAPVTEHGRSMILYRRDTDGRWRIHRDMDSPAPHAAPAPAAAAPSAAPTAMPASGSAMVPEMWDPAERSEPVACDRLSASRYDRTRLAAPVAREAIDVPKAIAQCEADLARLPGDARLHFQLGRLYGYAGDKEKTLFHRRAAAAAGNHNAIFLLGYLDWIAATDDAARCAAARTMKLAADRGNYSAQISYSSFAAEGRLAACPDAASSSEIAAYLAAARPVVDGFFETRLADHLIAAHGSSGTVLAAQDRMRTQMAGRWKGVFRRYDAQGTLTESLPSEILVRFPADGNPHDYHQTNILTLANGKQQRIETFGRWDGPALRFSSERVEGSYRPLAGDPSGLNSVLFMAFKDGSGLTVSEVITLSPDGKRRMRAAQYIVDGKIQRRTLIDEERSDL